MMETAMLNCPQPGPIFSDSSRMPYNPPSSGSVASRLPPYSPATSHHPMEMIYTNGGGGSPHHFNPPAPSPSSMGHMYPSASSSSSAPSMQCVCAGCGSKIQDRLMLKAMDRFWHTVCLKCSCCQTPLNDLGHSFYTRTNMVLCRKDYIKMFGTTGTCARCSTAIPADELVMRCQGSVYHLQCFACVQCNQRLQPGEKFSLVNGGLFCEHEFPKIFGPGSSPPASNTSSTGAPSTSSSGGTPAVSAPAAPPPPTKSKAKSKKVESRRPLPVC